MTAPLLLKQRQTAAVLGICEKTLWSITAPRGPIPCVRIGSAVRYSVASLEKWIAEQEAATR